MPQNFLSIDREQVLLMPPSLADWLPSDHLAWFVLEAVKEMDLDPFLAAYRADGHGRAAHDPRMMVALLLYAYARGERSSRRIERACVEDVAYRVIAANRKPDHATIARFRQRHETALAGLFVDVLRLCAQAGLAQVGLIAVDGSKLSANASQESSYDYERIAREILAEAARTDEAEDELYGEARGDELPEHLRTPEGRRAALQEAKRKLREREGMPPESGEELRVELDLDPEAIVAGQNGREGWLREARRQIERQREERADPIPSSRAARLLEAERRMRENLEAMRQANQAYEDYRAAGRMKDGRPFGGPPKPFTPPEIPEGKINVTDLDSGSMKTLRGRKPTRPAQQTQDSRRSLAALAAG